MKGKALCSLQGVVNRKAAGKFTGGLSVINLNLFTTGIRITACKK